MPLSFELLSFLIVNPVFQEMQGIGRLDIDLATKLLAPFALFRIKALFQIGGHKRMEGHFKFGRPVLLNQQRELVLHQFGEEDWRLCLAASRTGGTVFRCLDVHFRANPLTGDLHQAEFAQGKNVVLGFVHPHGVFHPVVDLLPVILLVHVDKIDHNNATHVPESKLTCHLIGCT